MPAIPSVSERTFVNSRLSCAVFTAAFAESTAATAASLVWMSFSSWLRAMARDSASGMSRSTSRVARPSCASACAFCPRAWSSAAWNGRGSISNSTSPFLT